MLKKLSSLLILFLGIVLVGCLEFEEQTLSFRHDEKSDTLYIFQDYRGIYGGERAEGLSEGEREQLTSVLQKERTFFFANWIFEYDRERMLEMQKELKGPAGTDDSLTGDERKQVLAFVELLLANVKVENGPFYYDASKRLCGVQKVTLKRVSEVIRQANLLMPMALKELAKDKNQENNKEALLKAAAKRKEFIKLQKNELSVIWPISRTDYEAGFNAAEVPPTLASYRKSGGKVSFKDDEVTFTIGNQTDAVTTLSLPVTKADKDYKGYVANAQVEVKKQAVILDKFDMEAARKEFLKRD